MKNEVNAYKAKLARMDDVFHKRLPDRVPALAMATTFIFHFSGISPKEFAWDMYHGEGELIFRAYENFFKKMNCDAILSMISPQWAGSSARLGRGVYELTDISMTANHLGELMHGEEYETFMQDPLHFLAEVVLPRKYPLLLDREASYPALAAYYEDNCNYMKNMDRFLNYMQNELGVIYLRGGRCQLAADVIVDFLRGIIGFAEDIKRRPAKFAQACAAFQQILFQIAEEIVPCRGRAVCATLHTGPYLNPADFKNIYFPNLKQHAEVLTSRGHNVTYFLEGDWTPYVDYFNELPQEKILCIFEYGNLADIKKRVTNIAVGGGMPIDLLCYGTKRQCLDYAKKLIDETAWDGRYIFATDKTLITLRDVNADNYFAVYNFVEEYGRY